MENVKSDVIQDYPSRNEAFTLDHFILFLKSGFQLNDGIHTVTSAAFYTIPINLCNVCESC